MSRYSSEYLFDLAFPVKLFIVEVNYCKQDIAIAEIRCKRGEEPKEKDNSKGFTENFTTYESAKKRAQHIANELEFSF